MDGTKYEDSFSLSWTNTVCNSWRYYVTDGVLCGESIAFEKEISSVGSYLRFFRDVTNHWDWFGAVVITAKDNSESSTKVFPGGAYSNLTESEVGIMYNGKN